MMISAALFTVAHVYLNGVTSQINYNHSVWSVPSEVWKAIESHQNFCLNNKTDFYNGTIEKLAVTAFIGQFKFSGNDPRKSEEQSAFTNFLGNFPQPPLKLFDPVVKRNCETTSQDCVHYIFKQLLVYYVEKLENKQNHHTYPGRNYHKISIRHRNEAITPVQLFYFQVTAMVYLCYWSLLIDDSINEMHWDCRFPGRQINLPLMNHCILNAFCPNPCCGTKQILNTNDDCQTLEEGICSTLRQELTSCRRYEGLRFYKDMSIDTFAKSGPLFECKCPKTMIWNREYLACVDEDECLSGMHSCDHNTQYCVNRVKGYFCACRWGYYRTGRYSCRLRGLQQLLIAQPKTTNNVIQPP